MNVTSKIVWKSVLDTNISVATSDEARALVKAFPAEPKYREWFQALVIIENPNND
jgi:hypothetical protein